MRYWILAGTLLLTLALSTCDSQKLAGLLTPTAQSKAAESVLDEIRKGDFAPVTAAMDPAVRSQMTPDVLQQLREVLTRNPLKSRKLLGSQISKSPTVTRYGISHEYEFESQWVMTQVVLQVQGGRQTIAGIHAQILPQSLEQLNGFTLSKKPPFLIFLALATCVPIFIAWTAFVCWRTSIPKRKWLWRVFVLVGIGACSLNWTTGDLRFMPIQFQLLGSGFTKPLFEPLILQIGFPLGAILFWVRRKSWLKQAGAAAGASG